MPKKGKKKKKSAIDIKNNPDIRLASGDFLLPNGDKYSGEYCAHRAGLIWRQGKGTYTTHDGQVYEGIWADDKLVDNSELVVKYPTGAIFHGRLLKNRYSGPGVYTLTNELDVSCQFNANKPMGEVALIDHNGTIWRGEAKEDRAVLIPENIFYLNIPPERGMGDLKEEYDLPPSKGASEVNFEEQEEEHSERYWEKVIFSKSVLTKNDVKFGDSAWCKNYGTFRKKKLEIERKLKEKEELTKDDEVWLAKFCEFKDEMKTMRIEEELRKKRSEEAVFDLNRKFQSPEFANSCPGVKVIYPREIKDNEITVDEQYTTLSFLSETSTSETTPSTLESIETPPVVTQKEHLRKSPIYLSELDNFARTLNRLPSDEQLSHAHTPKPKTPHLHFTPQRKFTILVPRIQTLLNQELFKDDEETKMLLEIMQSTTTSTATHQDAAQETISETKLDESKQSSLTSISKTPLVEEPPLTEKQKRIKGYIDERIAQWEAENPSTVEVRLTPVEIEDKKMRKHKHSRGLRTASIDDIPTEVFIDMFEERKH